MDNHVRFFNVIELVIDVRHYSLSTVNKPTAKISIKGILLLRKNKHQVHVFVMLPLNSPALCNKVINISSDEVCLVNSEDYSEHKDVGLEKSLK